MLSELYLTVKSYKLDKDTESANNAGFKSLKLQSQEKLKVKEEDDMSGNY